MRNIIGELKDKKQILFGPFLGSYEYELRYWSPFVKNYISENKEKQYVISTRDERRDIYNGFANNIDTYSFQGDDTKYRQKGFYCENIPFELYSRIIDGVKARYGSHHCCHPFDYAMDTSLFDKYTSTTVFNSVFSAKKIINSFDNNKKTITFFSFFRNNDRLWRYNDNTELMSLLNNNNQFTVFVCGLNPKYTESQNYFENVIDLNKYKTDILKTTMSGLSIEAVKKSDLVIGYNNTNLFLAKYLNTPIITWGAENSKYNFCTNLNKYKVVRLSPGDIFKNIKKFFDK